MLVSTERLDVEDKSQACSTHRPRSFSRWGVVRGVDLDDREAGGIESKPLFSRHLLLWIERVRLGERRIGPGTGADSNVGARRHHTRVLLDSDIDRGEHTGQPIGAVADLVSAGLLGAVRVIGLLRRVG